MRLAKTLYITQSVQDLGTVIYALRRNIPVFRLWCICLENGRLSVQSSRSLCLRGKDPLVLGFGMGQAETVEGLVAFVEAQAAAGADWSLYQKDTAEKLFCGIEAGKEA